MFGICHWWAISPIHPWSKIIRQVQTSVSDNDCKFNPHITICTNSSIDFKIDNVPNVFFCKMKISHTLTESTQGTLWCLEIPIENYERPDGEAAHISLAYKWNEPFSFEDIEIVRSICKPMTAFQCRLFDHQIWECNLEPSTWKRLD